MTINTDFSAMGLVGLEAFADRYLPDPRQDAAADVLAFILP